MITVMDLDVDWLTGDPLGFEAKTGEAEPFERCRIQMAAVMDEFMAATLRDVRAGRGESLRDLGLTAVAAELRRWQHD